MASHASNEQLKRIDAMLGRAHAQTLIYHLVSQSRDRYFSGAMKDRLGDFVAYDDLGFDTERMRRWAPLNQSLYYGYKIHLAGLLLNHKGDRVAMANSVETRYPFLDEDFIALVSRMAPRWKLRGIAQDKYILRQAAARLLPKEVAFRKKGMFRAPLAESFFINAPNFVRQLMSTESLNRTGYFDAATVRGDYDQIAAGQGSKINTFLKMGLTGVLSTQLWHHLYLGGGLCELPESAPPPQVERPTLPFPPAAA
jgi:asparagine synthase (glutamine-hydrolysing)